MSNNAQLKLMENIHSIIMPSFKFIGSFNTLPKEANIGDMCIINGDRYVYNNKWIDIGATATQPDYPTTITVENEKMKPKLCTQCGAPLHSNKCRFCDTEYY